MYSATKVLTAGLLLSAMLGISVTVFAGTSARYINLPAGTSVQDDDRDEPDVKARVARLSFIHGSAKVRHAGEKDWTKVTLNLPIVEGDEVVTDSDSRVEVQFDKDSHLRLEENSYLKVSTLQPAGIAVSINLGTMNVRLREFNKDAQFFEIDAPKTTLAVERSGSYRVDAGREGSPEVRTSIRAGGEARVYSDTAGFTLKNDRSAKIFIDGANAGEWETTDAGKLADDFDAWTLDRDDIITRRLKSASYGKYYDDDIYGADDLTDYGAWTNTRDYGWVWKPFDASVAQYSGWSPYRYGQWSWVPPFGWTWVGDEPWGWATYHHGRWIWAGGAWAWAPYGYYRPARSWWFPALVAINIVVNDVCWYPLGYHHRYNSYNNHHGGPVRNGPIRNDGGTPQGPDRGPIRLGDPNAVGPTPGVIVTPIKTEPVPAGGIVAIDRKKFGGSGGTHTVSDDIAPIVIKSVRQGELPEITDVKRNLGRELVAEQPQVAQPVRPIGAGDRKNGGPLDEDLNKKRMFGGRDPVKGNNSGDGGDTPRNTGAVDRDPVRPTQIRRSDSSDGKKTPDPVRVEPPREPVREIKRTPPQIRVEPPSDRQPDVKKAPPQIKVETRHDPPPDTKRAPEKTPPPKTPEPSKKESPPPPAKVDHKAAPKDGDSL